MSIEEHGGRKILVAPELDGTLQECSRSFSVCKGALFISCTRNASATVICFNEHIKKFLKTPLASGFQKCFIIFINRLQGKQVNSTVTADISTEAMGKILRRYNKVHGSMNGLNFRTEFQNVQLEDLKSPCLCELMAFHINVKETKNKSIPGSFDDCNLQISEERSSLSITLSNSKVLDVDLTCSICLETFFDPVSTTCSHMFCYMCACSAGSVTTIDGLKSADSKSKCPLCRKEGVFGGAVRMSQLNILLRRKFPENWEERRQKERQARLKESKLYWESQCRAFVGIS